MKAIGMMLGALVIAAAGLSSPANAEGERFCRDYATAALRQVHEAHETHFCERGLRDETRWSQDFHVHFDWCRGVSRSDTDAERDARTHFIDECRRH